MRNVKKLVESILQDRNEIIARLVYVQGVDLTNSDWSSFKPNEALQERSLEELTELTMSFEEKYKSLRLPEILQYCKERHALNENWSGIRKTDVLKLLGLESSSVIDTLFNGVE